MISNDSCRKSIDFYKKRKVFYNSSQDYRCRSNHSWSYPLPISRSSRGIQEISMRNHWFSNTNHEFAVPIKSLLIFQPLNLWFSLEIMRKNQELLVPIESLLSSPLLKLWFSLETHSFGLSNRWFWSLNYDFLNKSIDFDKKSHVLYPKSEIFGVDQIAPVAPLKNVGFHKETDIFHERITIPLMPEKLRFSCNVLRFPWSSMKLRCRSNHS